MKVSLSKTDCATETDALRLVPRRAVYDWLRDDVPLNVKMTVMPHHIDALMDRLSKAATAAEARADRLAKALEPFARVARWARLCGMSDLEKATAKYAKRNLFWDQFSAADAALNGDTGHAG